jgi:hypothetical protein
MTMALMRIFSAILLTIVCLSLYAADEPKQEPAEQENVFKRAGKQIGHDAKSAVKQAGHAFKEAGKAIGHGTVKTVHDIGHGMKESAAKTKQAAKDTVK